MKCQLIIEVNKEILSRAGIKLRKDLCHDNVTSEQIIQVALEKFISKK